MPVEKPHYRGGSTGLAASAEPAFHVRYPRLEPCVAHPHKEGLGVRPAIRPARAARDETPVLR